MSLFLCIIPPAADIWGGGACAAGDGEGADISSGVGGAFDSDGGDVINASAVGGVITGSGYGNDSGGDAVGGDSGTMDGGSKSLSLNGFSIVDETLVFSFPMEGKVTFFFSDSESSFFVLVLIFVIATVSVIFDDDDEDEIVNRVSWDLLVEEELFVQVEPEEEELLSCLFGVKQEEPHSCTLKTKLDFEPELTKVVAWLSLPGLEPESFSLLRTSEKSVNPL